MIREPNKYGKCEIQDLLDFQKTNKIQLPKDYVKFLEVYNGGKPIKKNLKIIKNDINWFLSVVEKPNWASLMNAIGTFFDRIPSWYFPIARMEGGNLLIMSLYEENYGMIANWDHENEAEEGEASQYFDNLTLVASSFSELLSKLE